MKKILLLTVFFLAACSSFGRGMVEALLDRSEEEKSLKQCEIRGQSFEGIATYLEQDKTVKVLMIHGVGTHYAGYSGRIQENLAKDLNLTVFSRRSKNITLISPKDRKTDIGNLRVTRMQTADRKKTLLFYELTWSIITSPEKQILAYDYSGLYSYKRAGFNNGIKKFFDDTVPDPMMYLVDNGDYILDSSKQAICWMLSSEFDELPFSEKKVCNVSAYNQIKDFADNDMVFITHSLGSRILIDTLADVVDSVSKADAKIVKSADSQKIINSMKNKELTVYMLANQLPMLQIGRKTPKIVNQYKQYCTKGGKYYNNRVFKSIDIVAFSDPNDILSYDIPQDFVDNYIDSRMCVNVTNVSLNIENPISAFGVSVVNPVAAHTQYDNDSRVIDLISYGSKVSTIGHVLYQQCRVIELKD